MAEPHIEFAKKIVSIFLETYNKMNSTQYAWRDDLSYQPKHQPYYDFVVFEGKKELGIQHVRATADPQREFVRPAGANKVIQPLRNLLLKNPSVPSLYVYLNFHNPPQNNKEREALIYWLDYFITVKSEKSSSSSYFNFDADFDEQFLPRLKKHVDKIEIEPLHSAKDKEITFAYSWTKEKIEPWMNDAERIILAASKKQTMSKSVLLLIEAGWSPVHNSYIPLIKKALSKSSIKEIWLVEPFLNQERAIRLK